MGMGVHARAARRGRPPLLLNAFAIALLTLASGRPAQS